MSAYDWADLNRHDVLEIEMVSPQNLNLSLGKLDNVLLSDTKLTCGYYTDSRVSGSLGLIDSSQYIPYSKIRFTHRIPEWNYSKELATLAVTGINYSRSKDTILENLSLGSILDLADLNIGESSWTVAAGASALTAMRQMIEHCGFEHRESSPSDFKMNGVCVYESGESFLSRLYDLSSLSGNRLDVDAHGNITISKYILPASKAASYRFNLTDARSIVLDGIKMNTNFFEIPNRAIVSYRYNEDVGDEHVEKEITAYVDATGSNSYGSIGYVVSNFYEVSDLNPPTYDKALEIAKSKLASSSKEKIEWNITVSYIPIWEGDTVDLVIADGPEEYQGVRHCLVKSAEINFTNWTVSLTLKETASGDEE